MCWSNVFLSAERYAMQPCIFNANASIAVTVIDFIAQIIFTLVISLIKGAQN